MARFKTDPPALKKKEEKLGKDLDGDKEKGESPAHKAKVLGKGGKKGMPLAFVKGKAGRGGKAGGKACPTCGKSPCVCK